MNNSHNITISAGHKEAKLDRISENILMFFPLFYKNILKLGNKNTRKNLLNMQLRMLIMLTHAGPMQPSEIGIRMGISKPNVSALVDKLIVLGYVERRPDEVDRRVIHVAITARGRRFETGRLQMVRKGIQNNLSGLSHDELDSLNTALETFKKIISKMDQS
jgi:DNA-binding MarR family transcriptional regulator